MATETAAPRLVSETESEYGVLVGPNGQVVHNSMQMDDPIIMRRYSNGMIHLLSKKTGKLIVAPYDPETVERLRCPHCDGELGA